MRKIYEEKDTDIPISVDKAVDWFVLFYCVAVSFIDFSIYPIQTKTTNAGKPRRNEDKGRCNKTKYDYKYNIG